jgi:hypothetical protein
MADANAPSRPGATGAVWPARSAVGGAPLRPADPPVYSQPPRHDARQARRIVALSR